MNLKILQRAPGGGRRRGPAVRQGARGDQQRFHESTGGQLGNEYVGLNPIPWPRQKPRSDPGPCDGKRQICKTILWFYGDKSTNFPKVLGERLMKGKAEMEVFLKTCQTAKPQSIQLPCSPRMRAFSGLRLLFHQLLWVQFAAFS